ncbi:MAG TPA: hypothetical protein VNI01_11375 [Elusimicrobiota bacterium]|jgi:hypothetical protein|nr:hypothetical protein [Elusimicrobiota bacterium]
MRRLVVASYLDLNQTRQRAMRLDFLAAAGVPVEYWDLSRLFGYPSDRSALSRPYVRHFDSERSFEAALAEPALEESVLVPGFTLEAKTYGTFARMSRSKASLGLVLISLLPTPPKSASFLMRPSKLAGALAGRAARAARKLGLVRGYALAFAAGDAGRAAAGGLPVVAVHHPDYDDWTEEAGRDARLVEGRYAVFLDQFTPHHPDYAVVGVKDRIAPGPYYDALNAYFRRLEERHGVSVVVAAHPKAEYPTNPFDGRRIFYSSTRPLVRFGEFAITSYSAAISFPVFARQPIAFIDADAVARLHRPLGLDQYPRHFASVLGGRYVRLDHPDDADVVLAPPDPGLYDRYKYSYLVSRENERVHSGEVYRRYFVESKSS